jgi:NAD(P)-dependent dehydrogenase (short-subunit alcohol dehydrogenase family)
VSFQGRVIVITGASSGVGRALARRFGADGAKVALLARNEPALQHAADEIKAAGGEALVLPVDVSDAAAVEAAADAVVQRWGGIDVWVNNAMVSVLSPALQMTADEFKRVTEVTYLGYVHGTLAAVRRMRVKGGVVIQIGSALAYRSIPLQSAYCAAKAAIRGFTDSLRTELLHDGTPVRLCMIQLPAVNTPQFTVVRSRMPHQPMPVPPVFQPELIADAVLRAARKPKREVWLGWPAVRAIVGQMLAPAYADRYLARRGYQAQQTSEPARPHPDNLFSPVPGDPGAHGPFDQTATSRSASMWLQSHRVGFLAGLAALGLAVAGVNRWSR